MNRGDMMRLVIGSMRKAARSTRTVIQSFSRRSRGERSVGFPYASQRVQHPLQMVSLCRWHRNNCDLYQQSVEQLLQRTPQRGPLMRLPGGATTLAVSRSDAPAASAEAARGIVRTGVPAARLP